METARDRGMNQSSYICRCVYTSSGPTAHRYVQYAPLLVVRTVNRGERQRGGASEYCIGYVHTSFFCCESSHLWARRFLCISSVSRRRQTPLPSSDEERGVRRDSCRAFTSHARIYGNRQQARQCGSLRLLRITIVAHVSTALSNQRRSECAHHGLPVPLAFYNADPPPLAQRQPYQQNTYGIEDGRCVTTRLLNNKQNHVPTVRLHSHSARSTPPLQKTIFCQLKFYLERAPPHRTLTMTMRHVEQRNQNSSFPRTSLSCSLFSLPLPSSRALTA